MAMTARVLIHHLLPLFFVFFFCAYSDAMISSSSSPSPSPSPSSSSSSSSSSCCSSSSSSSSASSSSSFQLFNNYPSSAKPHSQWINNPFSLQLLGSHDFSDGSTLRPILCTNDTPPFGFGSFANGTKDAFYLVVFMLLRYPDSSNNLSPYYPPVVIWSANRDHHVGENSTLEFTAGGDLVLNDFDGSFVWSTNTSSYFITSLNITMVGNLILYNSTGFHMWESFDYPTDTWLPYQYIPVGERLTSRSSPSNLSRGSFYLSVANNGVFAFIESVPPKTYATLLPDSLGSFSPSLGGLGINGSIHLFQGGAMFSSSDFGYIKLESNGHLNAYKVSKFVSGTGFDVQLPYDLLEDNQFGQCVYPTVCGNYGICSNGQCSCPGGNGTFFTQFNSLQLSLGCTEITPLSCENAELQEFLELENVTYFDFEPMDSIMDLEGCKNACLKNCSCKVALFRYGSNISSGQCSLSSQIYSLMTPVGDTVRLNYSSYSFLKVQRSPDRIKTPLPDIKEKGTLLKLALVVSIPVGIVIIVFVGVVCFYCFRASRSKEEEEEEDDDEEEVIGALAKFSFLELKFATQDFRTRRIWVGLRGSFERWCQNCC